jgi:thiamine transport system permease protein
MAIGFLAIYGRNGLLNSTLALFGFERLQILYSFGAILLGHVFYNAPIVILILGNALKRIPSDLLEMARMDGAGKLTRFLKVELPLAVPALVNSALLIFSYCFTSFAVVLILGGAQFATLEVSIYMYFRLLGRPKWPWRCR